MRRENVLGKYSLLNGVTSWRSCSVVPRDCVNRIRLGPLWRDDHSGVLIGEGMTRRSDCPARVLANGVSTRIDRFPTHEERSIARVHGQVAASCYTIIAICCSTSKSFRLRYKYPNQLHNFILRHLRWWLSFLPLMYVSCRMRVARKEISLYFKFVFFLRKSDRKATRKITWLWVYTNCPNLCDQSSLNKSTF